jgi:hypothetical protein
LADSAATVPAVASELGSVLAAWDPVSVMGLGFATFPYYFAAGYCSGFP